VELAKDKEFEWKFEEQTTSRAMTPAIEVSSDKGEDKLDDEGVEVPTIKMSKVAAATKKVAPSKQKDRSESVVYRSVKGLVSPSKFDLICQAENYT
jgi:hypothetical protein